MTCVNINVRTNFSGVLYKPVDGFAQLGSMVRLSKTTPRLRIDFDGEKKKQTNKQTKHTSVLSRKRLMLPSLFKLG